MYIVRQRISGYVEYIVDSDNPVQSVINLDNCCQEMPSTKTLEYTEDIEVRELTERDKNDPTIVRAIVKITDRQKGTAEVDSKRTRIRNKRPKAGVCKGPVEREL